MRIHGDPDPQHCPQQKKKNQVILVSLFLACNDKVKKEAKNGKAFNRAIAYYEKTLKKLNLN
jgi:hypothetical protein